VSPEGRPRVLFGDGSVGALPGVLRGLGVRRLLLITGSASFEASGAKAVLGPRLAGFTTERFSVSSPNPRLEDVGPAIGLFRDGGFDAVVGAGGGTAMDVAKLTATLGSQSEPAMEFIVHGRPLEPRRASLILLPTTAGTGSEVTRFAVVYIAGRKHSLDDPQVSADYAIVDPALTWSMPPALTASTGLDALSQAVEACWSVRSTDAARAYASAAVRLVLEHLEAACLAPTSPAREMLSLAALLSGRAIDIARTTGPHAMAYPLSMTFGVPHGHACALTLPEFLLLNSEITEASLTDGRGVAFVRDRIGDVLRALDVGDAGAGADRIRLLAQRCGLATRLSELGVAAADAERVLLGGFNAQRAANNPRRITPDVIRSIVQRIA
jgi:alcohol dehydrogenase